MKLKPPDGSSLALDSARPFWTSLELRAVAELWKKTGRSLITWFDGNSMLPTIKPREQVTVRCGRDAALGDVVLAIREPGLVVHRLIWRGRGSDWILTRGDARAVSDLPIAASAIIGVVDVAPLQERWKQRVVRYILIPVAVLGRVPATFAVRLLQIVSRVVPRNQRER